MPRAPKSARKKSAPGATPGLRSRIGSLGAAATPPAAPAAGAGAATPVVAVAPSRPVDFFVGGGGRRITVALIRRDGGTQGRIAIDSQTVEEYREALAQGATFPAVVLYYDGTDYWLADGFHRVEAHLKEKREDITAEVRQGTRRDAILHAAGANARHGLRRTTADKRWSVGLLLDDPEWSQKSDRWIAEQCSVTDKTVAAARKSLGAKTGAKPTARTGKDGRSRRMPAARPTPAVPPAPAPSPAASTAATPAAPSLAPDDTTLRDTIGGRSLSDIGLAERTTTVKAGGAQSAADQAAIAAIATVEESLDYLLSSEGVPAAIRTWAQDGLTLIRSHKP